MSIKVTTVKPPLYKLDIPDATRLTTWHWVRLRELAEVVGMPTRDVYLTFKDLAISDDKRWFGSVHWVREDGQACCQFSRHTEFPDNERLEDIFVPAGWSEDVLLADRHGITRLDRIMIYKKDIPWHDPNHGYVRVFNSIQQGRRGEDAIALVACTDKGFINRDGSREFLSQFK